MPLARISITLPHDLVEAADRRARQLDRSRSWVIAEALRASLASGSTARPAPFVVREPTTTYGAREVAEARTQRLRSDLALSPAERLRHNEALLDIAPERPPRPQVIAFDTYEDFYEWKTRHRAGA